MDVFRWTCADAFRWTFASRRRRRCTTVVRPGTPTSWSCPSTSQTWLGVGTVPLDGRASHLDGRALSFRWTHIMFADALGWTGDGAAQRMCVRERRSRGAAHSRESPPQRPGRGRVRPSLSLSLALSRSLFLSLARSFSFSLSLTHTLTHSLTLNLALSRSPCLSLALSNAKEVDGCVPHHYAGSL